MNLVIWIFGLIKNKEYQKKIINVYEEQIQDLEDVVPNFKIANATIHFDESSPHLHIVGVPFKEGSKNCMEKQVGKSDVFTAISLQNIQDKMREYCITSFNKFYNANYTLKEKEEGRNIDIQSINMKNYRKLKKEKEEHKKKLDELNNKVNELQNKSDQINEIMTNLKPNKLNKNNFTISSEEANEIKKYIVLANETTNNLKTSNELIATLDKYDKDLKEHNRIVKNLNQRINNRDVRIEKLEEDLEIANESIDDLEEKISILETAFNTLKIIWDKFIEFLQNKFFSTDKYDDFIQELYDEDILQEKDINKIQNYQEVKENEEFER